ncbi:glycine cleavage system aminomethyltransferase GcvT [Cyclobacterium marinum]|uniref:Aminomethyltransferase n=1 Tax=Cyclobacterium marinum (strain ATCC 25205 / DSM 745 / LMG 13164 / NCIMB 1802) TaxID=880070 RepID=G0J015_CYCMS|nr:glycine cleavage system aminomethyltransferase GcvT [Cyclobacterium marinum]AEL26517.1 Aminomethyltransferase [Cyclobacterium marinum DSM 745]MBI0399850.1 glycine cleavage system aminomethyltransferase GcvT [Cyclobacterium marinum]
MEEVRKVTLDEIHHSLGAKMIPFAGYNMPVRYSSDMEEHNTVRENVGVFDVSHMGEFIVEGPHALDLIQKVSSNDASKLKIGQAQYTCFPNDQGGVVDDFLVYKLEEERYMLVVNASNISKDWNWIQKHNTANAKLENISDQTSLFAIQGPKSIEAIQSLTTVSLKDIPFYHFEIGPFAGVENVIISATGYTGELGFELYIKNEDAKKVWEEIFKAGKPLGIKPIGLGARDTLRLEMGYCLYGHELNDSTSPLEAGLGWITKFTKNFINHENLRKQKEEGLKKKLIGFKLLERGIPRADYPILNAEGKEIGLVTSGSQSPSLGIGIGLGYVDIAYAKAGTEIKIQIRKKSVAAKVEKLPLLKK